MTEYAWTGGGSADFDSGGGGGSSDSSDSGGSSDEPDGPGSGVDFTGLAGDNDADDFEDIGSDSGSSVGPSRMGADDRTDGDAGASITVTSDNSDSGGGSDSSSSGDSDSSGNVSDTAIGASYRDPTLEQAAEDADGEDAADTVAAGGIASAINFGGLTEESVAEDAEATGTTGSLSDALDRAFNPESGGGDQSQEQTPPQNQTQNQPVQTVVERIREPIPTSFGRDSGPGSGTIVAVGAALLGLAMIAFAGGD